MFNTGNCSVPLVAPINGGNNDGFGGDGGWAWWIIILLKFKDISGELPEHRDFIYNKAIPAFESWGYKVTVLKPEKNYMDCFHHKTIRGKSVGIRELCEENNISLPEEYYLPTPPEVDNNYMATLKQKKRVKRLKQQGIQFSRKKLAYDLAQQSLF